MNGVEQSQNMANGSKNAPGRKPLIGGLSTDTFLCLSHTLRAYSDFITHLLDVKKFKFVLSGFSNNDRIEKYFCFMRYLSGMHLALDITSFCQNARTDLFRTISRLCMNKDGSHSKIAMRDFFADVLSMINSNENELINELHGKLRNLIGIPNDLACSSLKSPILPYVSGYAVTKFMKNCAVKCKACLSLLSMGINIADEIKEMLTYNVLYINERDKTGLTWPTESVVILSGVIFSIFNDVLSSENVMKLLMQSASSSRVGIRTLRRIVSENVSKYTTLNSLNCVCESCGCDRQSQVWSHLITILFNVATNNFTLLLNRRENAKKLSLKMVKMMKQKNSYKGSKTSSSDKESISNWTINDCKAFLRSHKGLLTGNVKVLRDRCELLHKLIQKDMQHLISLSIAELRKICSDLKLQDGNKDKMVENIFSALVNEDQSDENAVALLENSIVLDSN